MAIAENQITLEIVADGSGVSVDVDYSITEVIEEYAIGTESAATGLWGTEVPDLTEENPKLWYRQRVTWIDETITYNPSENGVIKKEVTETGLLSKNEIATAQSTAENANVAVSELGDTVGTVEENISNVQSDVSVLQEQAATAAQQDQLDAVNELVRQYIGEEGYVHIAGSTLMVGVGDFKTAITPEQIVFYDGDDVVSYISNKKMYISQTEVTQEQRMGDFVWRPREGGRMSLMFAPEGE